MKTKFWTFLGWPLIVIPLAFEYLGAGLNQLVIAANKGVFPVLMVNCKLAPSSEELHSCMVPGSHLKFLADWINLHDAIMSPGDVLIAISDAIQGPLFWFWAAAILYLALLYQTQSSK